MKQASSRELFGYWTAKRGTRHAPERGDIEPSAIRRALGDVFILEFDRHQSHPFRLAGTRVCALFGRELKNQPFLSLWDAPSRLAMANLLDTVADEKNGVVASGSGRTPEGWAQDVELLLLPLTQRGDTHARMIGALTPHGGSVLARFGQARTADAREHSPSRPGARSPARRPARRRHAPRRLHGARGWTALTFRGPAMRGIPHGMRGMREGTNSSLTMRGYDSRAASNGCTRARAAWHCCKRYSTSSL